MMSGLMGMGMGSGGMGITVGRAARAATPLTPPHPGWGMMTILTPSGAGIDID
jgi:hypothetical protein